MENKYMKIALKEAKKAYIKGEVPIGCCIVYNDKIIARAHNQRHNRQDTFGHAEAIAIRKANKKLGFWRLEDCIIYATLEPCPMCAGAILQARMKAVFYGAKDPKAGACGSVFNLYDYPFNHHVEVNSGVLELECSTLITTFFEELRDKK